MNNAIKQYGAFAKSSITGNMVCICTTSSTSAGRAAEVMSRFASCTLGGPRANVLELKASSPRVGGVIVYTMRGFKRLMSLQNK